MRLALLLLLALSMPVAAAGVPFEIELVDFASDTATRRNVPTEAPSADILRFTSRVENGTVVQRLEVNATPEPPYDYVLVRNWYANSTNGSFHALDIELTGEPEEEGAWIVGLRREGDFDNVSRVPVEWRIEGSAWVFEFDEALVADATCFDHGVFTRRAATLDTDAVYDAVWPNRRRCEQAPEPVRPPTPPTPRISVNLPDQENAPTVAAPGSRTPTPGIAPLALVAAFCGAALVAARRR